MEDAQDSLRDQDDQANEVMESVGVGEPTERIVEESSSVPHMQGDGNSGKEIDLPIGVKERLGRQEKRHLREMRQMRAELQQMQSMMSQPQEQQNTSGYGKPNPDVDEHIQKAVSLALLAQEEQKQKAKQREEQEHVDRHYQSLHSNLDKASDKYDDFDDVVRAQDAPFTSVMRDAALFLDNPAEVLYKLGKNREELKRISILPAIDQAKEMVKLSHALMMSGKETGLHNTSKPLGQVKSNPVYSSSVTEHTSPSEIRRRMKAGEWKSHRS